MIDAVVAMSDELALGALHVLQQGV